MMKSKEEGLLKIKKKLKWTKISKKLWIVTIMWKKLKIFFNEYDGYED